MSWRAWWWITGIFSSLVLVVCLAGLWLIATESGARWILARAAPMLPAELEIESVDGTLLQGLQLHSINWRDGKVQASIDLLSTHVELWPLIRRRISVTQLDVTGVDVVVTKEPADDAPEDPFVLDLPLELVVKAAKLTDARVSVNDESLAISHLDLSGRLDGSELSIRQLDLRTSLGDVDLSGDATLAGSYPASATATWRMRRPDQQSFSGTLTLRGDSANYQVTHSLSSPFEIRTQGQMSLAENGVSFNLDNSWDEIALAAENGQALTSRNGTLRLFGSADDFAFDGRAAIAFDHLPIFEVNLQGDRNGDVVSVESLVANSDAGRLEASGDLTITPELSWNAALHIVDLDPAFFDQRLDGRLDVIATSSGQISDGAPIASARIGDISGSFNGYPVTGSADLGYADSVFKADNATIEIGENRADITASIGEHLSLNAKLSLKKLGQLGLDAAGTLNGDFRLVTGPDSLQMGGTLNGRNLEWREYGAETLQAGFAVPVVGKGTIDLRLSGAHVGNIDVGESTVAVTGTTESHTLRVDIANAEASAQVRANGSLIDKRWSGRLGDMVVKGEPLGEWRLAEAVDLVISSAEFRLEKACLTSTSDSGFACAELSQEPPGELRFDVSLSELPLAALHLVLPQGTAVGGTIEGHARGSLVDRLITADSIIEIRNFGLSAVIDEEDISIEFGRAYASAAVVDNRLSGALEFRLKNATDHMTGKVEVIDILDPRSALNGEAQLELNDMSLFSLLVPDVADPAGRITGNLAVRGSLDAAEFVGVLGLTDGSFGVRRAGVTLTDINLQLRQTEAGRLALQGSARSGDGHVDIDSETTLSASGGIRSELRVKGENFTLLRLPDWRLNASPSIAVLFDEKQARISGEIGIPEASITIHEVPTSAVRPSGDVVVHRTGQAAPTPRRPIYIDVRTVLGDNVNLSAFGLQTGLEGAVRISGSSNTTYAASGRVTLREGKYKAYGQDLAIESGELIFNGPLTSPSLNVRATRTASDKTVAGIRLTGTPTQLRSEVYSEPALADAEALSYLLTGRPLGSANAEDGNMLNQAAFALGLTSAGNVASQIRNDLGLETLGIQGGSEDQQLVAGKRIGDRLLVEYAYGIIDNLGTLLLRYQLNDRLIIESRSGLARTVDLVYSVKKR
ncbi:MAG: translocation/assembly module TamB domain-containing protein [Gammaproteobacteria bacterium]|nr:translocation/assembly module TamB domain-containing protein [Gammaproteobacteria bacterium]